MSHLTKIKTYIRDINALKKAATKLDVSWETVGISQEFNPTLIVSQPNLIDIGFLFNGQSYELFADKSLWNHSLPIDLFLSKINLLYVMDLVNKQLKTIGFSIIGFSVQNDKGQIDLVAERWLA